MVLNILLMVFFCLFFKTMIAVTGDRKIVLKYSQIYSSKFVVSLSDTRILSLRYIH